MTAPSKGLGVRVCPSCGSPLNRGAQVCGSCGGVIAIEIGSRKIRERAAQLLLLLRPMLAERTIVLWFLALVPLLIAPPVFALFLLYRSTDSTKLAEQQTFVAMAAILNVVLSVMFWHWLGETTLSLGPGIWYFLKSLGIANSPILKATPI